MTTAFDGKVAAFGNQDLEDTRDICSIARLNTACWTNLLLQSTPDGEVAVAVWVVEGRSKDAGQLRALQRALETTITVGDYLTDRSVARCRDTCSIASNVLARHQWQEEQNQELRPHCDV